jgi:putative endonuclease
MYVYIISSLIRNWNYVGITKNIDDREEQHNSGKVSSTKAYRPYKLIFVQEFNNYKESRIVEKYLKIRFNKESLLQLINKPGW